MRWSDIKKRNTHTQREGERQRKNRHINHHHQQHIDLGSQISKGNRLLIHTHRRQHFTFFSFCFVLIAFRFQWVITNQFYLLPWRARTFSIKSLRGTARVGENVWGEREMIQKTCFENVKRIRNADNVEQCGGNRSSCHSVFYLMYIFNELNCRFCGRSCMKRCKKPPKHDFVLFFLLFSNLCLFAFQFGSILGACLLARRALIFRSLSLSLSLFMLWNFGSIYDSDSLWNWLKRMKTKAVSALSHSQPDIFEFWKCFECSVSPDKQFV